MDNYKGIYYNDSKEQKFFEGGAHFKYESLFKVLLSLGGKLQEDNYSNSPGLIHNYRKDNIQVDKDINYLLKKVEGKLSKFKTRNLTQFNYINNPNTKVKLNTRNLGKKGHLSIKKENPFHSRNINTNQFFERNNDSYVNKTTTSVLNNNIKNNINNNLINYLLYKKEMAMKNEEKNNDTIINNYNNDNNNNKQSITQYYKYIHNRNKSDAFINFNNNILNNINNSNSTKNIGSEKKSNIKNYHKKIMINKSNKSNKLNNINKNNNYINNNYYNKINNNKFSLEIKEKEINENDKDEIGEKTNINRCKNNYPLFYNESNISNLRDKIKSDLSYDKIAKRSRNIINKNIISYNTCGNNNNINNNYIKKYIKNYLPKEENKNKMNKGINYSYNLSNIQNNLNKAINNNNNTVYSFGNYENNIPKTINIKNKQKVIKSNGNNIMIQKYIKKKINQLYVFNQNNYKNKVGNVNIPNNMNKLSNINSKYIIQ